MKSIACGVPACRALLSFLLITPQIIHAEAIHSKIDAASITVEDLARFATIGDPQHVNWYESVEEAGVFSPDRRHVAVVVRRGNLEKQANDGVLLVYLTADLLRNPRPEVVAKFSSTTNYQPIARVRWLADNETMVFSGTRENALSQVYRVNIRTQKLEQLTDLSSQLLWYDSTPSGERLVTLSELSRHPPAADPLCRRRGCRVTADAVWDAVDGFPTGSTRLEVHDVRTGKTEMLASPEAIDKTIVRCDNELPGGISPNGRFALRTCIVNELPHWWSEYSADPSIRSCIERKNLARCFRRVVLIDLEKRVSVALSDAPYLRFHGDPQWVDGGRYLILPSALESLTGVTGDERTRRAAAFAVLRIDPLTRETTRIAQFDPEAPRVNVATESPRVELTIEQSLNDRPVLVAIDKKTNVKRRVLDPNPWLAERKLGRVQAITWESGDGSTWSGGLYYPANYQPGLRYPLVIQTHGFEPERFSLVGYARNFAGQALVAHDIAVLQVAERVGNVVGRPMEWPTVQSGYEGAIDYLDRAGIADRNRIGIQGWSRTAAHVGYTLSQSSYTFAAGAFTDPGSFSWLWYMMAGAPQDVESFYGAAPFGEGIKTWLEYSATFNLERIRTPMLMWQSRGIGALWDWYAGLRRLRKPVELWYLPDGAHDVFQVGQRIQTNELLVDWFRFWLKHEEDPDSAKSDQYSRWRQFREQQEAKQVDLARRARTTGWNRGG